MNPNDRELEQAWQAQAFQESDRVEARSEGNQTLLYGQGEDEWLVIRYE